MILTRHLTPTLTVIALATTAPHLDDEQPAPDYPLAPTQPYDGEWYPCRLPDNTPGGTSLICAVQWGDTP